MESAEGVDESLSGTFAPAIILPAQYFSALRHRTGLDGERRLRLAVLEDGIECYLKNMNAKSRLRRILFFQVRDWMKADYGDGPFSFDLLCQEFGMDGSHVRNALERRRATAKGRTLTAMLASSCRDLHASPAVGL